MIQRVKWNNHIVLGDLELDFTKNDGSSYSTIVLAGENGTGKTTILEHQQSRNFYFKMFLLSQLLFGYLFCHL